jgi:hypothetical protein
MPTHRQNTTEAVVTERSLGRAASNSLRAAFANSPLYNGEWSDAAVHAYWIENVQERAINDGGHTFGLFVQNYKDAPNPEDVNTGGGGRPAGPFVPTTASPGVEGSINPYDLPEVPPTPRTNIYGTGPGISLTPKDASSNVAKGTLGSYLMGKSGGIPE